MMLCLYYMLLLLTMTYSNNHAHKDAGVALRYLSEKNISVKRSSKHAFNSFESMELELKCRGTLLRMIILYRPPRSMKNTSSIGDFFKEFSTFIETQMSSSGMFLIGGDFNINIGNNTSSDASKFLDLL